MRGVHSMVWNCMQTPLQSVIKQFFSDQDRLFVFGPFESNRCVTQQMVACTWNIDEE